MSDTADLAARAERAYGRTVTGDFEGVGELVGELDAQPSPLARGHAATLRAHAWFADLPFGRAPSVEKAKALAADRAATGGVTARYLLLALRERLLAFDASAMRTLAAIAERTSPTDEATAARLALARCWPSAVTDPAPGVEAALREAFERARRAGLGPLAIDAQAALALAHMVAGDLEQATRVCRRASRMARTEAFPQQEYLAHLLLARVRRLNGVPHLSTHILNALVAIGPAPYQPWLRWERLLSGADRDARAADAVSPVEQAVRHLAAQMDAARHGDVATLRRSRAGLLGVVDAFPVVAAEALDFSVALDPEAPVSEATPAMRRWLTASTPLPPHGLYGAEPGAQDEAEAPADTGFIVVGPERPARRVLGAGAALADVEPLADTEGQRRRARTQTGLAVLAFRAPDAMGITDFFRAVYGFDFNPEVHPAVLNTLVSRMRSALGAAGEVIRTDDSLAIRLVTDVALPDPRCGQPLEDRVLRILVRAQSGTAKEAAQRLGVPLRRIQEALKQLAEGGACLKRREGRQIEYVVEDTTFSPPTRA